MNAALDHGALHLANVIREGKIRVSEAVDGVVRRLQARNPTLHALVAECYERAHQHALRHERTLEEHQREGTLDALPPLFGVPFVVSESLALAGMNHASGSRFRSDRIAGEDATVVARLIAAGAIPIGLANTAELGFWLETDNLVYGRTASPYDSKRIAGGAAGGVAALVAARCVPFGIGVDMVGSLRMAGHCCGVFTHKPSGGLVPVTGFEPTPDGRMRRYTGVGPVTNHPDDLLAIMKIIAGPDARDSVSQHQPPFTEERWDPMWKRVVVIRDFGIPALRTDPEVLRQLDVATRILETQGAVIEHWHPRELREAFWIWLALVHEGYGLHWNFADRIVPGQRKAWFPELIRVPFGQSRISFPVAMMAITETLTKESFLRIQTLSAAGRRLRERIHSLLADDGILMLPVSPLLAPKHGRTLWSPQLVAYTALFNTLELPVTTVPLMGAKSRLPVGIQLVARASHDALSIQAAREIARHAPALSPPGTKKSRFFGSGERA